MEIYLNTQEEKIRPTFDGYYNYKIKEQMPLETFKFFLDLLVVDQSDTLYAHWTVNYNRYTVECLVDENGNIVNQTDAIVSGKTYKTVEKVFDVAENDTTTKTFCIGKLKSKTKVTY